MNGVMTSEHVHIISKKKSENVTAVSMRIQVFWDMTSYRFVYSLWGFGASSSWPVSSWMKFSTFNPWIRNVGNQCSGKQLACTIPSLSCTAPDTSPQPPQYEAWMLSITTHHLIVHFLNILTVIEATTQSRFSFWLQHYTTYPSTFISCDHIQVTTTALSTPVVYLSTR